MLNSFVSFRQFLIYIIESERKKNVQIETFKKQ